MPSKKSAGILPYKIKEGELLVMLGHPGGPFFKNKDDGHWSIFKGEFTDEEPLAAAMREFGEETGLEISGAHKALSPVTIKSGKTIFGFAVECDLDISNAQSNSFELEWPPRSGLIKNFPEIDKFEWFTIQMARLKIHPGQLPLLAELERIVSAGS